MVTKKQTGQIIAVGVAAFVAVKLFKPEIIDKFGVGRYMKYEVPGRNFPSNIVDSPRFNKFPIRPETPRDKYGQVR